MLFLFFVNWNIALPVCYLSRHVHVVLTWDTLFIAINFYNLETVTITFKQF